MKAFNYDPIYTNVYSPKKSTSFTFDKNQLIRISLIDYIDLDEKTGDFCVRNFFTGSVTTLSDKGPKLKMNQKILKEFLNDNERFEKTENPSSKRAEEAEKSSYQEDARDRRKGAYG